MDTIVQQELFASYSDNLSPPFSGSVDQWCNQHIDLPSAYAIPGKFSVNSSPYLIQPFQDLRDPKVMMVNMIGATQIGKSLLAELYIPFIIANDPGPLLRLHQNDDIGEVFTATRLIPMLKNCKPIQSMLMLNRFVATKKGLTLPHMNIKVSSAKESMLHGLSIRYLLMDEAHLYDVGTIEKAIARTTAFAGRRKIIISSQPNVHGSELEKWYNKGLIFSWHWLCPHCKKHQPYRWWQRRSDNTYAGINWDTILNDDKDTTNILLSSRTAWLECYDCRHKVSDTIENRRYLNDTGKYVCTKTDGDPTIHSYTVPQFVNINISFADLVVQYLNAKKLEPLGLDEDMITFKNQVLGAFYKASVQDDHSKIARGEYSTDPNHKSPDSIRIMTVDVQRRGLIKYYVIREWNKKGNESRRIAFGVCRTWGEVDDIRKKYGVSNACVGVDSGDGVTSQDVYQACISHGEWTPDKKIWLNWIPMKGDQKMSYIHEDKVNRYYSPPSKQSVSWPSDSKYRGMPAKLILWSNWSVKSILMSLRDNKVDGVKWLVDSKDATYEQQMYSEGIKSILDKKTGTTIQRWVQIGEDNHYLDTEAMNLTLAIKFNCFSATKINEDELMKMLPKDANTPSPTK